MEELLLRRFTELGREEIRTMFQLQDIRKSKVWREAHEEGEASVREDLVRKWLAKGKTVKEIADVMEISVKKVRRLAKHAPK